MDNQQSTATETKNRSNKKIITISAAILILGVILGMCFVPLNKTKSAISSDFVDVQDTPSLAELTLTNSFYYVPLDMPGYKAQHYSKYMTVLVDNSLKAADQLMKAHGKVKKETDQAYATLSDLIIACDKTGDTQYLNNGTLYAEADRLISNAELCEIGYESMVVGDSDDMLINTEVISKKLVFSMAAGESITDAFVLAANVSAVVMRENQDNQDKTVQRLIKKLDKHFSSSSAYENIQTIAILTDVINDNTSLAEIAKAEVALENLAYAKEQIPTVQADIEQLKTQDVFSTDEIEGLVFMSDQLIGMMDGIEEELNKTIDDTQLAAPNATYFLSDVFVVHASADAGDWFGMSVNPANALDAEKMEQSSGGIWQGIKNAASASVDLAISTAKTTRSVVGYTVDRAGSLVHGATLMGYAAIDSRVDVADVTEYIVEKHEEVEKAWDEGVSGADTFQQAEDYFTGGNALVEDGMYNIGSGVEQAIISTGEVFGIDIPVENTLSYAMSGVGTIVAGTFTGLGTGISKVANAKASSGKITSGLVDIGFSLIGGSSNVFNTSEFTKTGVKKLLSLFSKESAETAAKKIGKEVAEEASEKGIKKLTKALSSKTSDAVKSAKKNLSSGLEDSIFSNSWTSTLFNLENVFNNAGSRAKIVDGAVDLIGDTVGHIANGYIDGKISSGVQSLVNELSDGIIVDDKGNTVDVSDQIDTTVKAGGVFSADTIAMLEKEGITDLGIDIADVVDDSYLDDYETETSETDSLISEEVQIDSSDTENATGDTLTDEDAAAWVDELNGESERPDGAKYMWVLDWVDDSVPAAYVDQYYSDDENVKSYFEYRNGYRVYHQTHPPNYEGDLTEVIEWVHRWSTIKDSYYEGEIVYGRWVFTPKTINYEQSLSSGKANNTIYVWVEDREEMSAEVWIKEVSSSTPATQEYSFTLPMVEKKKDVMVIQDMNGTMYYYTAERIK